MKDVPGNLLAIDIANCLISSEGPVVTAIGVSDLIVIATGDAVVIMPRGDSQYRGAVEALKRDEHVTFYGVLGSNIEQ